MDVPTAIEFRSVSFTRPGGACVLDRFDLTVESGDVLALVGRSGAGKTTLLKLVNRMLMPRLRRRVGYVIQEIGLFPHMTVAGNVGVVPRLEGWPPERVASRVHELLELIGLPPDRFASRWPDELSGGQRQRVGVARALAVDPPVVLMDEPFGALDPLTRAELHSEFRRIQNRLRKTVIIVTHDMGETLGCGSCSTPSSVYQHPSARVYARAQRPRLGRVGVGPHENRKGLGASWGGVIPQPFTRARESTLEREVLERAWGWGPKRAE
ncbi:MAG: ABC transporter ATP-binding protein [Acidobacteria bacterium]|nr:MAG: ABC transporter ATP-binding protein [Acidobacteriota bacterium]